VGAQQIKPHLPLRAVPAGERVKAILADLPADGAARVLAALDDLSRPMTAREIERSLRAGGMSSARCDYVATALKGFWIVAIMPNSEGPNDE